LYWLLSARPFCLLLMPTTRESTLDLSSFFSILPRPRFFTLFPYTTLFRSPFFHCFGAKGPQILSIIGFQPNSAPTVTLTSLARDRWSVRSLVQFRHVGHLREPPVLNFGQGAVVLEIGDRRVQTRRKTVALLQQ